MILPTRRLLWLWLLPVLPMVLWRTPVVFAAVAAYDVVLILIAAVDVLSSARPEQLQVHRRSITHLSLGAWNAVGWGIRNDSGIDVAFEVTDDLPAEIERDRRRVSGRIRGRSADELSYRVRPTQRGLHHFGDIHLRWWTPFGLVIRQRRISAGVDVKVYPNVANLARYEMAVRRHRRNELGLQSVRQRGRGSVFESLREYLPGDEIGDVAWKATARRGKLITRNYETERSQTVLLVIDCGRLMTTQVDELSRLDYAINASILMTYVAMKQGDHIGMVAFSDKVERYVPPIKGRQALGRMNEALYRLEPRLCEPNYERACHFLALRHRKRSLVVIFTDVINEEASSMLLAYTARFARLHLPLCVTMRNLETESLADQAPRVPPDAFTQAVADRKSVV